MYIPTNPIVGSDKIALNILYKDPISNQTQRYNHYQYPDKYQNELVYCNDKNCYKSKVDIPFSNEVPSIKGVSQGTPDYGNLLTQKEIDSQYIFKEGILANCPLNYNEDIKDTYTYEFMHPSGINSKQIFKNQQYPTQTDFEIQTAKQYIINNDFITWKGQITYKYYNTKHILNVYQLIINQESLTMRINGNYTTYQDDKLLNTLTDYQKLQITNSGVNMYLSPKYTINADIIQSSIINNNFKSFKFKGQLTLRTFLPDEKYNSTTFQLNGSYDQDIGITSQINTIATIPELVGELQINPIKVTYPNNDIRSFEYIPFIAGENSNFIDYQKYISRSSTQLPSTWRNIDQLLNAHFAKRCRYDITKDPECLITEDSICRDRYIKNKDDQQLNTLINNYCKKEVTSIDVLNDKFNKCHNNWNTNNAQYKQWNQSICSLNPTKTVQDRVLAYNQTNPVVMQLPPIFTVGCNDLFNKLYSLLTDYEKEAIMIWVQNNQNQLNNLSILQQQVVEQFKQNYYIEYPIQTTQTIQPVTNAQTGQQDVFQNAQQTSQSIVLQQQTDTTYNNQNTNIDQQNDNGLLTQNDVFYNKISLQSIVMLLIFIATIISLFTIAKIIYNSKHKQTKSSYINQTQTINSFQEQQQNNVQFNKNSSN